MLAQGPVTPRQSRATTVKYGILPFRADSSQLFSVSSPAKREKTGAVAKAEFLNLQLNGLLSGTQLLFSLEPMFLVMTRFLSRRKPDFVSPQHDIIVGRGRFCF